MWALYNSYHYESLDRRKNKEKEAEIKINQHEKKGNINSSSIKNQDFSNIFCQGNRVSRPKDPKEEISSDDIKKFKRITPLFHQLWEKSVEEARLRGKHDKNISKLYNESYDMQFREFPDEYISKNNPYKPKLFEELGSSDLSWMTKISLNDLHPNLTLEQQYYHLKDMEMYYMINLWRTKWNEIRSEQDYWYELKDNTFWIEARRNRQNAKDPGAREYFINKIKEFYYDQKLHYNKYKNIENIEDSVESGDLLNEYSFIPLTKKINKVTNSQVK
ncbi:hypothetical protein BCR36DRAFT_412293 [Piromyces finnis]|uniref:Uncharacterized protein n=1 Tax=Piromyces finnis TaxID=1754191 RepID=A0A1Y1V9A9_9FUNG|nr:hypothetical protein BCR36DRAFT_412293 [Piromyces finnis]|eukprot:ORX50262.1 hypothetical protein BCR36DRAFT_412293 [Piromyces finnis]